MLQTDTTALVLIDVQEKLARVMYERDAMIDATARLLRGLKALQVPVVWVEQNPKGLGPTVGELAEQLAGKEPITKRSFSCCRADGFMEALSALGRNQVLVAGIEAHICVYQTAVGLRDAGYEVEVLADCVSSRTPVNKHIALEKLKVLGIGPTSMEMALFELLGAAEGDVFREILKIVK
jgi:nicotinamidase-related amidase